jgi:PAS domain-containing protein
VYKGKTMRNAVSTSSNATKGYQHHTKFNQDDMDKYSLRQHDMTVTIDIAGRITECTAQASALFGKRADELSGVAISDVIPQLPFASNTPYYNFAYAVFHSGNDNSMRRMTLDANGKNVPIDITLSRTVVKGRRLIKVRLAPPEIGAMKEPLT